MTKINKYEAILIMRALELKKDNMLSYQAGYDIQAMEAINKLIDKMDSIVKA